MKGNWWKCTEISENLSLFGVTIHLLCFHFSIQEGQKRKQIEYHLTLRCPFKCTNQSSLKNLMSKVFPHLFSPTLGLKAPIGHKKRNADEVKGNYIKESFFKKKMEQQWQAGGARPTWVSEERTLRFLKAFRKGDTYCMLKFCSLSLFQSLFWRHNQCTRVLGKVSMALYLPSHFVLSFFFIMAIDLSDVLIHPTYFSHRYVSRCSSIAGRTFSWLWSREAPGRRGWPRRTHSSVLAGWQK